MRFTAKASSSVVSLLAAGIMFTAPASFAAGLRSPQVPMNGASLQSYFNSVGQAINPNLDQWDIQCWSTTVSNNATFTVQLELAGFAPNNAVGVYNCNDPGPTLYQIFPGAASPGWFAVASFNVGVPGRLVVNLFDNNALFQGQTVYNGVNSQSFGFYMAGPGGTFFSEDSRNPAGGAQMLTYPGTGTSSGQWWLCIDDQVYATGDQDFNDFVMFMESVNPPVPTEATTWGNLKSMYGGNR